MTWLPAETGGERRLGYYALTPLGVGRVILLEGDLLQMGIMGLDGTFLTVWRPNYALLAPECVALFVGSLWHELNDCMEKRGFYEGLGEFVEEETQISQVLYWHWAWHERRMAELAYLPESPRIVALFWALARRLYTIPECSILYALVFRRPLSPWQPISRQP